MEFAISQPKMVRLPRNEKQTYRLNSRPQMWPSGLTLAMTLTLIFKVKYGICYVSAKNGPIAMKRKTNISIELLGSNVTLTLNFQGQIWTLLYLSQKWSDCQGTKSKHIDWTPRPQMWPSGLTLAMTLTLDFQGQTWNLLYLSQKWSDCHATKSKHIDWTPGLKCDQWVWPWP